MVRTASSNELSHSLYDHDLPSHVILMHDWMNQTIDDKYTKFLYAEGDESIADILINGRGISVNPDISLDYQTPKSVFFVKQNKRYRFRVINSGSQFCPLQVSIDNHSLKLIALDGNAIVPVDVTSFFILAGYIQYNYTIRLF